jgi:hypothetical protein
MATAQPTKRRPVTMCTGLAGKSESTWPNATATTLWTVSADEAPRKTGRGLWRVARKSEASDVLSGSSARKMMANTERNRVRSMWSR